MRNLTDLLVAWGPLGILLLSILDSSGVPVAGVFDALLILLAVKSPTTGWLCAAMAVVGSTTGNLILFWTARKGGEKFSTPPQPGTRAAKFRGWFRRYGLVTVFIPALVPIPMPLKLFVVSAGVLGTPAFEFGAVVVVARILRYFGEVWLGIQLGADSTKFLKTHALHFSLGAVAMFVVFYLFIRWRDSRATPVGGEAS